MKVNPMEDMTQAYRDLSPVSNRNLEKNIEKVSTVQVNEPKENPAQKAKEAAEINDGREVIGVSRDGDIAKASRDSIESFNEGIVLKKTQDAEQDKSTSVNDATAEGSRASEDGREAAPVNNTEVQGNDPAMQKNNAAAQENDVKAQDNAGEQKAKEEGSLLGYSRDELRRLYLQGEIDSNRLEKEIERRDEVRGEKDDAARSVLEDEKEEKQINNETAVAMEDKREYGVAQVTARDDKVKEAQDAASDKRNEASKLETSNERAKEADDKAATDEAAENRKRIITEEMALDDEFSKEMSVYSGAMSENERTSEALDVAVENDRLKIMEQVLGVDPATASNV